MWRQLLRLFMKDSNPELRSGDKSRASSGDAERAVYSCQEESDVKWLDPTENRWGVPVLDLRPFVARTTVWTTEERYAANAASWGADDGRSFIGEHPPCNRETSARLAYPLRGPLADGILFSPQEMEHRWAMFLYDRRIFCIRSWTRELQLMAEIEVSGDYAIVTKITGAFFESPEDPALTARMFDCLMYTHALSTPYPAPLADEVAAEPHQAAATCFGLYGNLVLLATHHAFDRPVPDRPLRTFSMLHVATSRGDKRMIESQLQKGLPVDLLDNNGMAALHCAVHVDRPDLIAFLHKCGAQVDVGSEHHDATPLMIASELGRTECLKQLLELGADVGARDVRGFPAIHAAANTGHLQTVRLLLEHGAMANENVHGHTPRTLAQTHGHSDVLDLLGRYGG